MPHLSSLSGLALKNSWLTIGVFDGVHRGHQFLVQTLTAGAHQHGAPAVVITFAPHPLQTLRGLQIPCLTTPQERADLLLNLGVDWVITLPFDRALAEQTPEEFMKMASRPLGLKRLLIGYDFALGKNRAGTPQRLAEIGNQMGYETQSLSAQTAPAGQVFSSSAARAALAAGDVRQTQSILGRPYRVSGQVVSGDGRGRTIGLPTANLQSQPEDKALPAVGVYACRAWVNGESFQAVTNIGLRPTFTTGQVSPRIEAHLLDFSADLYGQPLTLEFIERLRGEQKFDSVAALLSQIQADIVRAREIFAA